MKEVVIRDELRRSTFNSLIYFAIDCISCNVNVSLQGFVNQEGKESGSDDANRFFLTVLFKKGRLMQIFKIYWCPVKEKRLFHFVRKTGILAIPLG